MLGKADATPMIAVKDIDRAKQFYSDKLGLKPVQEMGGDFFMLKSGDTTLNVYRSEFAGTNKATALTFDVDDIDAEVRELKDKGITFEHYDVQGLKADGDKNIAHLKTLRAAAFDKAYIDREVAYHQQVIDALDKVLIPGATNGELKALLVKVRPAFVAHLEHAKRLQATADSTH